MIYKLLIITLLSLLLTACNNNKQISENQPSNDNNSYARLGFEENTKPDEIIIQGNIPTPRNNNNEINNLDESKDYIADNFSNDELIRNDDLNNDYNLLATFTTPILTSDPNRYHNIKIVRDRLNGYVLQNNEVFSYNKVCGPYGKSDGFKEATILLSNGKEDKGYGGGVCQLSTTLYNAVKNLNIEITERHHHSIPVAYVKNNEDATVSLQSDLDFKFKNKTGKALKFKVTSTEKSLTVSVYEYE